jgi:hypothetical protein
MESLSTQLVLGRPMSKSLYFYKCPPSLDIFQSWSHTTFLFSISKEQWVPPLPSTSVTLPKLCLVGGMCESLTISSCKVPVLVDFADFFSSRPVIKDVLYDWTVCLSYFFLQDIRPYTKNLVMAPSVSSL